VAFIPVFCLSLSVWLSVSVVLIFVGDAQELRKSVIEMIVATDSSLHYEYVTKLSAKAASQTPEWDVNNPGERLLLLKCIVKVGTTNPLHDTARHAHTHACLNYQPTRHRTTFYTAMLKSPACVCQMADISNVARLWDHGFHWSELVTEEFFAQGMAAACAESLQRRHDCSTVSLPGNATVLHQHTVSSFWWQLTGALRRGS
jgi:hypothetical protein